MQAADIFHLDVDIAQLGMDQRKVNMLAREVAPKMGLKKPIVVSHHMLMGLGKPPETELRGVDRAIEFKMSKSKPDTAIFMTDSEEDIKRKIQKAYCMEGAIEENPIMEYCKYIIFEKFNKLRIERPAKFGGDLEIVGYTELEAIYRTKELHPMDLKSAVADRINELLKPVREHFEKNNKARDLLNQMASFEVTR
jgi:tyrosyl-tRNA synthetase